MAEIDPRVRRIRRIGVGVFLAMAAGAVPLGLHIKQRWESPELGLTLLGAVLLLVLISLFALETAVTPIPEPLYTAEDAAGLDLDPTELVAPEEGHTVLDGQEAMQEMSEMETEMEVEAATETETEIDDEAPTANPDGPVMIVPNPALAHATTVDEEPDQ